MASDSVLTRCRAPEQAGLEVFYLFGKPGAGREKAEGVRIGKESVHVLSGLQPSRKVHLSPRPSQAPFLWKLQQAACHNLIWLFPGRSLCRPTLLLPFPATNCLFQGHLQPYQLFQDLSKSSVSQSPVAQGPSLLEPGGF